MHRLASKGLLMSAALLASAPLFAAEQRPAPVVTSTMPGTESLDARVTKLERLLEGQALTDMLLRVQQMQQELQKLRGDLEVQTNEINGLKQRQRDLYLDIDRRLRQAETSAQAAPAASASGAAGAPGGVASAPVGGSPEQERAAYQQAFDKLKEGRYDEAITLFRGVLANYPNGKLSDNAQYWLGEANYVTRRYREAVEEFGKVIANHPQSQKIPDALMKRGFSYYELGDWAKARESLEQVASRYPQSPAAAKAATRLQKMKAEGRCAGPGFIVERLKLPEIFLSLQGESRRVGLPTTIVRLTGCPQRCQYCDTAYAFHGGEWRTVDEIVQQVAALGTRHVCVTGGEPLAQKGSLPLLRALCDAGHEVSLETSGAITVAEVDQRVIKVMDLKTPASGEVERNRYDNLPQLTARDQITYVLCDRADKNR